MLIRGIFMRQRWDSTGVKSSARWYRGDCIIYKRDTLSSRIMPQLCFNVFRASRVTFETWFWFTVTGRLSFIITNIYENFMQLFSANFELWNGASRISKLVFWFTVKLNLSNVLFFFRNKEGGSRQSNNADAQTRGNDDGQTESVSLRGTKRFVESTK